MFVFRDRRKTSKNVLTVNKFRLLLQQACEAWSLHRLAIIVEYQLWACVCVCREGGMARAYEKTLHVERGLRTIHYAKQTGRTRRENFPGDGLNTKFKNYSNT